MNHNPFGEEEENSNPFASEDGQESTTNPFAGENEIYSINSPPPIPSDRNPFQDSHIISVAPVRPVKPLKTVRTDQNLPNTFEVGRNTEVIMINNPSMTENGSNKDFFSTGLARGNVLLHKNRFSDIWMVVFLLIHFGQYAVMLSVGKKVLSPLYFSVILSMVLLVPLLIILARMRITLNTKHRRRHNLDVLTPEDEADNVPNSSIYLLALAGVVEGISYALFSALTAGRAKPENGIGSGLSNHGFYTQNTMLQALRFASITLLCFHRMLRPANRVDPMRTMLELEVVSVCWDALDGSTLMELLDGPDLGPDFESAARTLMAFWFLSVGFRLAAMLFTALPSGSWGHDLVLTTPLEVSPHPTVDRTMQSMRLRSLVILCMAPADFFAASLRLALWSRGLLDTLQQEMAIKNLMFLSTVYGAYAMRMSTVLRDWNSRDLGFGLLIPSRAFQLQFSRFLFVISYGLVGLLLSVILIYVTNQRDTWVINIGTDFAFVSIFLVYFRNVHIHRVIDMPGCFLMPKPSFVLFPTTPALIFSLLMLINLFAARLPALYLHYSSMATDDSGDLWTFNNAILLVLLSVIPISAGGSFWSIAYMLFKSEFTSSPGNYNAIHDPCINMVATSTQVEGALDVLSCASFLALAATPLPPALPPLCIIFAYLELLNACQCFGLQALLSGGHDDTPLDLVKFKAYLRAFRCLIDFLSLIFRVVLWVKFEAISSVFLIKNLYNLMHGGVQVERWRLAAKYPKYTLFTEHVPPQDWYGMSMEEWREATSLTIADQARRGRTV